MYKVNSPYIDEKSFCMYPGWKKNSHGFRGDAYDSSKKNILIAGCSIHFCYALGDEYIFPNLLIDKLGGDYGYLNVSMPGIGIDAQLKNITWALSNFKFDKFIWLMPPTDRSLYYHETEGILPFLPGAPEPFPHKWFSSVKGQAWADARIANDYDATCKIADHTETLFLLLNALKIDSYVQSWSADYDSGILGKLREKFNIKTLPHFRGPDKAADNIHPGIISHKSYADELYKLLTKTS